MTSTTDRNDLMPPQVFKLEWVTPKISLMVAEDTEHKDTEIVIDYDGCVAHQVGTTQIHRDPPDRF